MERNPTKMPYAATKVEPESSLSEMIKQVLRIVQKEGALTKKQARRTFHFNRDESTIQTSRVFYLIFDCSSPPR